MLNQYDKLKNILREMFQMDQADLDFGIYRIMNAKRAEIEKFLDEELLPQVKEEFSQHRGTEIEDKKKELSQLEKTIRDSGMNPDDAPKVKSLREEIGKYGDDESLANEVFSHLSTFFRRYYDNGDFISLRRYKKDTYAIPYEGEEVKLHWANADQYYIKTSEYLKDYGLPFREGKRSASSWWRRRRKRTTSSPNRARNGNSCSMRKNLYEKKAKSLSSGSFTCQIRRNRRNTTRPLMKQ